MAPCPLERCTVHDDHGDDSLGATTIIYCLPRPGSVSTCDMPPLPDRPDCSSPWTTTPAPTSTTPPPPTSVPPPPTATSVPPRQLLTFQTQMACGGVLVRYQCYP